MSNYPPGVTGRELEIAGPSWEGHVDRACDEPDVQIRMVTAEVASLIEKWLNVRGADSEPMAKERMLRALMQAQDPWEITMENCPFESEVEAWAHRGMLHWTCPLCGTEHEEDDEVD